LISSSVIQWLLIVFGKSIKRREESINGSMMGQRKENMTTKFPTLEFKAEVFAFLDTIRKEGSINMFESPRLISEMYGLDKQDAKQMFLDWTVDFSSRQQD